ncbi:D-lysine 5,6-aminomutase beta subunit [uncultured spirochete]|jgi:beta-lysine 5,6-aminomutase beta subunit|uniref:D-lysine 5,6-aminomutase beta subunit n=1 Tax=uncultured spirochete TaxID=156406 RepID=A0A3P3XS98_9SPIR|nr:D-lysine 5,6-aminomutase beta subunit [uncultured spirochete]
MAKIIKPYGDAMDDGKVQLSFTLPVPAGSRAMEAARRIALAWGFHEAEVVHMAPMSDEFTFFVVYAATSRGIDWDTVEGDRDDGEKPMSMDEINAFIRARIGRKIVVIGACTGFDAHTVGIDAIMNMKGYNHHYGLERYEMIDAHNLGAQIPNEKLIEYAETHRADAILVSQVVTQKDSHIHNLTEFMELLEAKGERGRFICIAGGPRISNKLAAKIGFDAGFGHGTYAEDVATFIVKKMAQERRT